MIFFPDLFFLFFLIIANDFPQLDFFHVCPVSIPDPTRIVYLAFLAFEIWGFFLLFITVCSFSLFVLSIVNLFRYLGKLCVFLLFCCFSLFSKEKKIDHVTLL